MVLRTNGKESTNINFGVIKIIKAIRPEPKTIADSNLLNKLPKNIPRETRRAVLISSTSSVRLSEIRIGLLNKKYLLKSRVANMDSTNTMSVRSSRYDIMSEGSLGKILFLFIDGEVFSFTVKTMPARKETININDAKIYEK